MRDPKRINEFLDVLKACWEKYPDWRFMQLICNVQKSIDQDGFYIEDNKMIKMLKTLFQLGE